MRPRTIIVLSGIFIGVVAIFVAIRVNWISFNVTQQVMSSSVVRMLRCQGIEHPDLTQGGSPWTLDYSWSGGYGPGNVTFQLNSGGQATLTFAESGQSSPQIIEYEMAEKDVSQVATAVHETGLLCQTPHLRNGYVVIDLGRFAVSVTHDHYTKTVFVDECHTLVDPAALFEVIGALSKLSPPLHESIAWGPAGTSTRASDQACIDFAAGAPSVEEPLLPPTVAAAVAEGRISTNLLVVEEVTYQGDMAFHIIDSSFFDIGDEHALLDEDGQVICRFGGFAGQVASGSCDIAQIIYVRTLWERN
jgi:hypothetical protein